MQNYKLTLQYDGTRYKGWQRLGAGENTIQGKLEQTLSAVTGQTIEITGSSRTDAGVHALGQTASVKLAEVWSEEKLKNVLNHRLPPDISIIRVEKVHADFHARFHAKEKTYLYQIWNENYSQPFMRKYSMHVKKRLNIDAMQKAGQYFVGEHDFTAYTNAKSNKKKTVRTIYALEIEADGGMLFIRVRGNGFLYNMVRKMVGTLIEVGMGEKQTDDIPAILASKERQQTGRMAEACGLFLEEVVY